MAVIADLFHLLLRQQSLSLLTVCAVFSIVTPAFSQIPPVIDLRTGSSSGVTEITVDWGDNFGYQPTYVGDVNGDGFDDFIVVQFRQGRCCHDNQPQGYPRGYSALVYGGPQAQFGRNLDLTELTQTRFVHYLFDAEGFFPTCNRPFSGLGDVDEDGYDDFLISSCLSSWSGVKNSGVIFLVFGNPDFGDEIDLEQLDRSGVRFLTIISTEENARAGLEVANAGDLNGDGQFEIAITTKGKATEDDAIDEQVYIIYGGFDVSKDVRLSEVGLSVPGSLMYAAYGDDSLGSGRRSLAAAGDLNGDGYGDFLVGADEASRSVRQAGAVYVLYGGEDIPVDLHTSLPHEFGVEFQGATEFGSLGAAVAGVGDVDGDGLDDFIAGAAGDGMHSTGEAFLIYGSKEWPRRVRVDDQGIRSFRLIGTGSPFVREGSLGRAFAKLGDLNEDGFADFLVSAPRQSVRFGTRVGRAFVIFGGVDLPRSALDQDVGSAELDGITILGRDAYFWLGQQAEACGDLDGDGRVDLLMTSPISDGTGGVRLAEQKSRLYVFWGGRFHSQDLQLFSIEPAEGGLDGGYEVELSGSGFTGQEIVLFGGVESPAVKALSSVELKVVVPRGATAGPVSVEVRGAGDSVEISQGFSYTPRPAYPDLPLDPEQLKDQGYRTLIYTDFLTAPFHFLVRGFVRVHSTHLNNDRAAEIVVAGDGRVVILFGGESLPTEIGPGEAPIHGTVIQGNLETGTNLGNHLAFPGDLDGDGFPDIVNGGALDPSTPDPFSPGGRTYIIFGRAVWPESLSMDTELAEGRAIVLPHASCGASQVAGPGDLTGDGFPDLVVGFDLCLGAQAEVRLYLDGLRRTDDARAPAALITGDPEPPELPIPGALEPRRFGASVDRAGDLNGDGLPDFLVGAGHSIGEAYLVLGRDSGFPPEISINDLIAENQAVRVRRNLILGDYGEVVAGGGDFNGDGLSDPLLGIPGGGQDSHGEVYVVFGSELFGKSVQELDLLEPGPWRVQIVGEDPYDWSGNVVHLGDWNSDGFSDVGIVTGNIRNPISRAYIVFGEEDPPESIQLSNLGERGFRIVGLEGNWLSGAPTGSIAAGDFDGDGTMDLALGESTPETLRAVVIFGRRPVRGTFLRGDADSDGAVGLVDPIFILNYLFSGGASVSCEDAADSDDDGSVSATDAVYLLNYLFASGLKPAPPYPEEGKDPTEDSLDCRVP